ncbi:tRNA-splicing endonuclease subunit Sen54 [Geodia barretti]|uniref:tRNA-splicing endonuclease subunit Sen54 n=3 Tax=Geodia barretti TaxID=519541 RepID=A0AA35T1X4_GEOBA|nr:tRNA-splicing endonuclease subunit Sen54 [Geodia barretti]
MLHQMQDSGQAFQEPLAQAALAAMGEKKQDRKLPKGLGEKRLRLEGTPEETEKLHHYLSGQMAAQSAPRATSRRSMSTVRWDLTTQLASVITQKGSHWATHGHTHSGQLVLEPHETLFLMEMGCLEVEIAGGHANLQQVYGTIICDSLTLQEYTVIASLKRSGFVVKRCLVSWLSPNTDSDANSSAGITIDARLELVPSCPLCHPMPPPSSPPLQSLLEVYRPGSKFKKSSPSPPQFRVCVASARDPFPSPSLLSQLAAIQPSSGVTLKWCVVDGPSLTYSTVVPGTIPPPH